MRVTGPKPDCANTRFRSRADGEVDVAAPPAAVAEVMAAGDAAAVDAAEDVGEVIDEAPGCGTLTSRLDSTPESSTSGCG